jgi:hypothetical protein
MWSDFVTPIFAASHTKQPIAVQLDRITSAPLTIAVSRALSPLKIIVRLG